MHDNRSYKVRRSGDALSTLLRSLAHEGLAAVEQPAWFTPENRAET